LRRNTSARARILVPISCGLAIVAIRLILVNGEGESLINTGREIDVDCEVVVAASEFDGKTISDIMVVAKADVDSIKVDVEVGGRSDS
jgi:hypothetical protein